MMITPGVFEREMKQIEENGSSSKMQEAEKIIKDVLESLGYTAGLRIYERLKGQQEAK